MNKPQNFDCLLGKTLINIKGQEGDEQMVFETADGETYRMYHYQDCCESVYLEDISGDLADLIGSPILVAEESESNEAQLEEDKNRESFTWTFYKLATLKGYVTLRWLGESSGYYSESVSFEQTA